MHSNFDAYQTDDVANQFRNLVDTVGGILWTAEFGSQRMEFVSKQAERVLGYPVSDWLNNDNFWQDHIHPLDRQRVVEYAFGESECGRGHRLVYRMLAADGRTVWLDDLVGVVLKEGKPVRLHGVMVDVTAMKEAEARLRLEKELLELIATGAPLSESLATLAIAIELHLEDVRCSILLVDDTGRHLTHGAAPSLPMDYVRAIDGMAIGPSAGSCGTAAYRREPIVVEDICDDPLWSDYRELASRHSLRSCWSTPIIDSRGQLLGTFAIYKSEPSRPPNELLQFFDLATQIAIIAINKERAESALATKTKLLEITGELAKIGGWEFDVASRRLSWTSETFRIHELDADFEPTIEQAINFYEPAAQRIIRDGVATGIESGTPWSLELPLITAKGRRIWVLAQGTPVTENGKVVKLLGAFQDITQRKESEASRDALETQVRESQKLKAVGTLAGGIAHDFNNILAIILGNEELGRMDLSNGNLVNVERSFEEIRKAGVRARDLVNQILSFSRRQPAHLKPTKLEPVVEECVRLLKATFPSSLVIQADVAAPIPSVNADVTLMQQVIVNLATNSMQAMKGRPGRIHIRLDAVGIDNDFIDKNSAVLGIHSKHPRPVVRLTVSDNGCGMDAATMDRIFEPFFTTNKVGQGTGLGLSVVHGIVIAHEGEIMVSSELGVGSTFTVYLPSNPAESTEIAEVSHLAGVDTVCDGSERASRCKWNGARVLLIDDNEAVLQSVKSLLESCGCRVTAYSNPLEAIHELHCDPTIADWALVDYSLRGMCGIDVIQRLRAIRDELPVVITSGFIDDQLFALAKAVGVKELLPKPYSRVDLIEIISRFALIKSGNCSEGN